VSTGEKYLADYLAGDAAHEKAGVEKNKSTQINTR
jgi:hypothetical protein